MKKLSNDRIKKLRQLIDLPLFKDFEDWISESLESCKSKVLHADDYEGFLVGKGRGLQLLDLLENIDQIRKIEKI